MASEKARRENVHPAIDLEGLSSLVECSNSKKIVTHKGANILHSSHVDQGIRGEGLGGVQIELHGQEQEGAETKKNSEMQRKEGEEGRVHGGIHPEEAGTKKRAERKAPALAPRAAPGDHYKKAKDFGASVLHDAKESASQGLGAARYYATAHAQAKIKV
ncbi:uncharacterized protein LOC129871042 [Solanum dulcamara]|uniref:uncharacterized protein LOC129871042 n=1 Tax=Solanum dulcamara TaxID=45834 RepID=UPI002486C612|nr:uncharacterized protein LOC129871042 [Solanum dulcamara]